MTLTFRFFRDQNGRLRCTCEELGITKPVERADGKRSVYCRCGYFCRQNKALSFQFVYLKIGN